MVHNELPNLDSDVVELQKTRLESGIQKSDKFVVFISGSERKRYELDRSF